MTTPTVSGLHWATLMANGGHDIDPSSDTFKWMAILPTWDPDLSGPLGYADASSHECSGSGYAAGGLTVTPTFNRNGQLLITLSGDIAHTSAVLTDYAFGALYSDDATAPVAKPIIAIGVLAVTGANNGGTFTIPLYGSPAANTLLRLPGAG